jgi:hypothetical protein
MTKQLHVLIGEKEIALCRFSFFKIPLDGYGEIMSQSSLAAVNGRSDLTGYEFNGPIPLSFFQTIHNTQRQKNKIKTLLTLRWINHSDSRRKSPTGRGMVEMLQPLTGSQHAVAGRKFPANNL